jgi:hypothetical protein
LKKLIYLSLVASSLLASDTLREPKEAVAKYKLSYDVGMRFDEFVWNKGKTNYTHTDGNTYRPDILSELTWSEMQSIYHRFNLRGDEGPYVIKAYYGFSTSSDGDNQDSDYLYSGRNGEFSRSNNSAEDSYFRDYSIAVGQKYNFNDKYRFVFLMGYSNHLQELTIKEGTQTIPATGSIAGLDSKYEATWRGPFVGLDFESYDNGTFSFSVGGKFQYLDMEAEGTWNLRNDLMQPTSFRQDGDGYGISANVTAKYKYNNNLYFTLKYDKSRYTLEDGQDTMYFANGSVGKAILNEATSDTDYISVGIEYKF